MTVEPTTKDKQITIEVPEDRVAEFYAFYGRFLAGPRGPGRRGHGRHGHGCRSRRPGSEAAEQPQGVAAETTSI